MNISEKLSFNFNPGTLGVSSSNVKLIHQEYQDLNSFNSPLKQINDSRLIHEKIKEIANDIWSIDMELSVVHSSTTFTTLLSYAIALRAKNKIKLLTSLHEHNGGLVAFESLSNYYDRSYLSDEEISSEKLFENSISKYKPTVCFLSHVFYDTGWILPIEKYGEIIKKNNLETIFIVDAAQSIGLIDLPKTNFIDAMFGSSHKWLMGPQGAGLLWTSKHLRSKIESIYLLNKSNLGSGFSISGGMDYSINLQILESLKLYKINTLKNVQESVSRLSNIFWANVSVVLKKYDVNVKRLSSFSLFECAPFLVMYFDDYDPYDLYKKMDQKGVFVKCIKNCIINNNNYHLLRIGIAYGETEDRVRIACKIVDDALCELSRS